MLRGRHYFDPDAKAAEQMLGIVPELRDTVWANRGFHQRAATWIAGQGIRQFIDIGAGFPSVGNAHEVVRRISTDARVVYTDSDPMVVEAYAGKIAGLGESVAVIHADPRDPDSILGHPRVRALIDPGEPTGLLMTGVMAFVGDRARPHDLVARYLREQARGSYLALSHLTHDSKPPAAVEGCRQAFGTAAEHLTFRSKAEVARFFDGLELVSPHQTAGPEIAYCGVWGAEDVNLADSEGSRWLYCGVARTP
ncbi:MAG: SAM-dependent methyltransferase [Streptosporangiales bacterium]|jgi:hypothetical protein|nr:SAM-dependent methyltransferase [Streptosporangiales bacterium]